MPLTPIAGRVPVVRFQPRPMHGNMRRWMEAKFCSRREAVYGPWFSKRIVGRVKHTYLPWVWGDGRQIIGIRPVATSLGCYMIAGDSSWHLNNDDGLRAYLDDIYTLLEEQFGECHCEDCDSEYADEFGPEKYGPYDIFREWPTPCFSVGTRWFREEMRRG